MLKKAPERLHLPPQQLAKKLIKRVLHACVREQLLPFTFIENTLIILLKRTKQMIIVYGAKHHHLQKFTLEGEILLLTNGQSQPIKQVRILLNLIYHELHDVIQAKQWQQFADEIHNCHVNLNLVEKYIRSFHHEMSEKITQSHYKTFIEFIASQYSTHEQLIFFERWATNGHPYHPCHKTKLGFNKKAYLAFSPEFNQDILLPVAAIEKNIIHIEKETQDFDYSQWFAAHFPHILQAFKQRLHAKKLSQAAYYPIFIHPWQYKNILKKHFPDLISKKQLILFKDIVLKTNASLSFRTLIAKEGLYPHIKLPVAVQSTSAIRTISPASVQNGPKLSKILQQIFLQEKNFADSIKCVYENCGLHIKHEHADIAKYLGIIYRENPSHCLNEKQLPIVVAALFEASPLNQLPLFIEIMKLAQGDSLENTQTYFDYYCRIVLRGFFDLFLIYGIALEGHQQNTIAVFENYYPTFMIARDFGGLRIHAPTLTRRGFSFNPYPQSATITDDEQEVTNKFLHSVIQYHLGEIILLLTEYHKVSETVFWKIVKKNLIARFEELKPKVEAKRWQREYHAILVEDWQMKSLMRMRLNNLYNKYIYIDLKNPLRDL